MTVSPKFPVSAADEFRDGMITIVPMIIAALPIGLIFGALAAQKGLSPLEVMLMSAGVFAGGAQFVALEIWSHPAPWLTLTVSALLVNLRHVLMSASLAPKVARGFRPWQRALGFFVLTDEVWALAEQRAATRVLTPAWYAGMVIPFYLNWVIAATAGAITGTVLGDTTRFGLDFAFPALFIALIMSFWKGPRTGAVLAASALAATGTYLTLGGAWYVIAGALAGVLVAYVTAAETDETGAQDQ